MKQQPWRRLPSAYALPGTLQPRITDVDRWQHLNNVAQIGLHGEALQQWLLATLGPDAWRGAVDGLALPPGAHLALQANATDFLAEAYYPAPLATGVRLLAVDDAGFTVGSALFQHGTCVGLHQARLGLWADGQPLALAPPLQASLQARLQAVAAAQPAVAGDASAADTGAALLPSHAHTHPDHWPWQISINARFADADALGQTSDHTLARCAEQARVQFLTRVFGANRVTEPVGFMVAHVALRWHRRQPAPQAWQVGIGVQRVGERSMAVRSALFDGDSCLAESNSVMVVIDQATRRPSALPEASRTALAPYLLPGA